MDEFGLIRRYFAALSEPTDSVIRGIGDDAAILAPPTGHELLMTSDSLVAGRHFPLSTTAFDIGWKALAVNLSDLAAMGAQPLWFLLALTLQEPDEAWLAGFADGLGTLAREHGIALVGGDTTRGPLSVTITAVGSAPAGTALRRDRARPGDLVCVTGSLGDAALGLRLTGHRDAEVQDDAREPCAQTQHDLVTLRTRLDRPTPRLAAGRALRGLATAAIDLSDGLAGDLGHVLAASGIGAELEAEALPMSEAFARQAEGGDRLALQAAGGDDYELCICLPPAHLAAVQQALPPLPLTVIGRVVAEPGLRWRAADGRLLNPQLRSYQHFDER